MALDDGRQRGQARYLRGLEFRLGPWAPVGEGRDHDHCGYCWAKFSMAQEDLHSGWTDTAHEHWICEDCYRDFADQLR